MIHWWNLFGVTKDILLYAASRLGGGGKGSVKTVDSRRCDFSLICKYNQFWIHGHHFLLHPLQVAYHLRLDFHIGIFHQDAFQQSMGLEQQLLLTFDVGGLGKPGEQASGLFPIGFCCLKRHFFDFHLGLG